MILIYNPTCFNQNLTNFEIWSSNLRNNWTNGQNVQFNQLILEPYQFIAICNNENITYLNFTCDAIIDMNINDSLAIMVNNGQTIIDSLIIQNGNFSRNESITHGNINGDLNGIEWIQGIGYSSNVYNSNSIYTGSDLDINSDTTTTNRIEICKNSSSWPSWTISLFRAGIPSGLATKMTQTNDYDDEIGFVTLFVGFTRAKDEDLNGKQPVQQYKLYVTNQTANGTIMTLISSKSIQELGGTSGSTIPNAFKLEHTSVGINEKFVIVSSNINGDSDRSLQQYVEDWARPESSPVSVKQEKDEAQQKGLISASISFTHKFLSNETVGRLGLMGYRLYLGSNNQTIQFINEIPLDKLIGYNPSLIGSGKTITGKFEIIESIDSYTQWIIVAYNTLFEANPEYRIIFSVEDDQGLNQAATAAVVAVASMGVASSVSAVTGASTTASTATSAVTGATGGASGATTGAPMIGQTSTSITSSSAGGGAQTGTTTASSNTGGDTGGDPGFLVNFMQTISMIGKMSISMPLTLRSFGSSMNFTNGEFGIYCAFANCENGRTSDGHSRLELLMGGGKSPEDYFRETAIGFGIILILVFCVLLLQFGYIFSASHKTKGMFRKYWKYRSYVLKAALFCLYGLLTSSLFILSINGVSDFDIAFACIIILFLGIPAPAIGTYVFIWLMKTKKKYNYSLTTKEILKNEKHEKIAISFGSLVKGCREGAEWYPLLNIYRKVLLACGTSLLVNEPYIQCWFIAIIFQICFIANVLSLPFQGGIKSHNFHLDLAYHTIQLLICYILIYYFDNSTSPPESFGLLMMLLQIAVILIVSLKGLSSLMKLSKRISKKYSKANRDASSATKKLKKNSDFPDDVVKLTNEIPDSFFGAVAGKLNKLSKVKPKNDDQTLRNQSFFSFSFNENAENKSQNGNTRPKVIPMVIFGDDINPTLQANEMENTQADLYETIENEKGEQTDFGLQGTTNEIENPTTTNVANYHQDEIKEKEEKDDNNNNNITQSNLTNNQ